MKKKIKDLTLEEVKKICDTYNGWNACRNCPLDTNNEDICKFHNLDKYDNEEIEVEENEN